MQKNDAKICVYQKKAVILHRGFVRALGREEKIGARTSNGWKLLKK